MKRHISNFAIGAAFAVAGCVGVPAPMADAVTMPADATYIADMTAGQAEPMTLAVTVDNDQVVAYATNGTNEEAWFFGSQNAGKVDMTSMYADRIQATYDGRTLRGTLTMNGDTATHEFSAAAAAAPAGIYTAVMDGARASWVVRPDRTITGVMDNSAPGDHKVTDALGAQQQQYRDQVRQMRLDQQMQQAPPMQYGTWTAMIHDVPVTATRSAAPCGSKRSDYRLPPSRSATDRYGSHDFDCGREYCRPTTNPTSRRCARSSRAPRSATPWSGTTSPSTGSSPPSSR